MELFFTILLPFSLFTIGLWIKKIARIKMTGFGEIVSFSYIMSLAVVFGILYLGSIIHLFGISSLIVLALTIISLIHLSFCFLAKGIRSSAIKKSLQSVSREKLIIIVLAISVLSVFAVFLNSRAILDSDVTQEYLPTAREIVKGNGFTYSNGYNYNIQLKPIGASVLYAWTYSTSGSTSSEVFRLMPLVPLMVLIVLTYLIASFVTKSKTVGIVSTALFLVLPFNDRFLLYNAFYPDMFYYPLVISSSYLLVKFFDSKQNSLLLLAGIGLGIAGLLKAQTIFVLIAFLVVLVALELRHFKKLSAVICIFSPFYILIPSILASSIQSSGLHLNLPNLSQEQWVLLVFLALFIGICFFGFLRQTIFDIKTKVYSTITNLLKRLMLLLIPFAAFSSLWYLSNFFKFGTLIWTSSINLPNYQWALGTLQSIQPIQPVFDFVDYLEYFSLMVVDPAVMGYVLLIPFLVGFIFFLKKRIPSFQVFMLFQIILTSVILSTVILSSASVMSYNPRDIFVLAPLLATLCGLGIVSAIIRLRTSQKDSVTIFVSFTLVAFFGLLSYIHSVLVQFVDKFHMTITTSIMSSLIKIVGLNLTQTSMQLTYTERATFVGDNVLRIVLFSLLCGLPLIFLLFLYSKRIPRNALNYYLQNIKKRRINYAEGFIIIVVLLNVIIIPRAEIFAVEGAFNGIQNNQLKQNYGDLYELIADFKNNTFTGGILTYESIDGLPYYLSGIKFIDLIYPANLGFLKSCLLQNSTNEAVIQLRQLGIHYLLINPSNIEGLDVSLNLSLSKIMQNPEFSIFSKKYGSWRLYTIGPYRVENTPIPITNWSLDPQLTTAPYVLNSNSSGIILSLNASDTISRVTITKADSPILNISDYDYIGVNVQGTSNARILIRFFLNDGTSFDLSYWDNAYKVMNTPFELKPYYSKILRGDIYISIKSSDGLPAFIDISEITFTKIKEW
jgi:hypothetical protein